MAVSILAHGMGWGSMELPDSSGSEAGNTTRGIDGRWGQKFSSSVYGPEDVVSADLQKDGAKTWLIANFW